MSFELLEKLKSEQFHRMVGVLLPAPSLRLVLKRNEFVRATAKAFGAGTLTDENIRDFLASVMAELRPREPLEHDLAIAAITVALEESSSEFAARFIADLASLSIVEMQLAPAIARECAKHRMPPARTFKKTFAVDASGPRHLDVKCFVDVGEATTPQGTYLTTPRGAYGAA